MVAVTKKVIRGKSAGCALQSHPVCRGVIETDDQRWECSCVCHSDPDFQDVCKSCNQPVMFRKTESGSLMPFDADGKRHPRHSDH